MAINNTPFRGHTFNLSALSVLDTLGATTPAMYGNTFRDMWGDEVFDSDRNRVFTSEMTRRFSEETMRPITATETIARVYADYIDRQARTVASAGPDRTTDVWGRASQISEDFLNHPNDALTGARMIDTERARQMAMQISRPPPELTAVRVGLNNQVNTSVSIGATFGDEYTSTYGTNTGRFTSAVLAQKHLQPEDTKPSEDLEELCEDHGLRIEELESQVAALLDRLGGLEVRLSTAEDLLWELRGKD